MRNGNGRWNHMGANCGRLFDQAKRIVHEGNVRRVVVRRDADTVVQFPLTIGVVGAVISPFLAAAGTIAALATNCQIAVERVESVEAETEDAESDVESAGSGHQPAYDVAWGESSLDILRTAELCEAGISP